MKHFHQKKSFVETCFFALLYSSFLLPLIIYFNIWKPFETPKAFFFQFIMEMIFPFYFILVSQYPEIRPSRKNYFLITLICFLIFETIASLLGKDPINSFLGNGERFDGLILWWHLPLLYLYLDCAVHIRSTAKKTFLIYF